MKQIGQSLLLDFLVDCHYVAFLLISDSFYFEEIITYFSQILEKDF